MRTISSSPLGFVKHLAYLFPLLTFLVLWVVPASSPEYDRYAKAMRGFTNLWLAGHAVISGHLSVLFDQPSYAEMVRSYFGRGFVEQMWGYPPSMLLVAVPFSLPPLWLGFLLWSVLSCAMIWLSVKHLGVKQAAMLAMLSPPALEGILNGQNGALTASLMLFACASIGKRPLHAGLALGLLTLKPQFGFLFPICLLAARDWRSAISASIVALVVAILSIAFFGIESWHSFIAVTRPLMTSVLERDWTAASTQINFVSPFIALRAAGVGLSLAYVVQGVIAVTCFVCVWKAWRMQHADVAMRAVLTSCLSVLASPYSHTYDLVVVGASVAILIVHNSGFTRIERFGLGLAWIWPATSVLAGVAMPGPLPASLASLSIAAVAFCAWQRLELKQIFRLADSSDESVDFSFSQGRG